MMKSSQFGLQVTQITLHYYILHIILSLSKT